MTSLIIPTYYANQHLVDMTARCLYSLHQTDTPDEVILVDDGSPIMAMHELSTIDIRLPENQGYSAAMNVGLEAAVSCVECDKLACDLCKSEKQRRMATWNQDASKTAVTSLRNNLPVSLGISSTRQDATNTSENNLVGRQEYTTHPDESTKKGTSISDSASMTGQWNTGMSWNKNLGVSSKKGNQSTTRTASGTTTDQKISNSGLEQLGMGNELQTSSVPTAKNHICSNHRAATGDILIVGNNDLTFTENWLTELLRPLDEGFDLACCWTSDQEYQLSNSITENSKFGSLFAMNRIVYETIGGFDEQFRGYFADDDYRERLLAAGFRIGRNNNLVVEHVAKATYKEVDPDDTEYRRAKLLYEIKYGEPLWGVEPSVF